MLVFDRAQVLVCIWAQPEALLWPVCAQTAWELQMSPAESSLASPSLLPLMVRQLHSRDGVAASVKLVTWGLAASPSRLQPGQRMA